jgi:4-hydroxybenzoate polyprenyltransferase
MFRHQNRAATELRPQLWPLLRVADGDFFAEHVLEREEHAFRDLAIVHFVYKAEVALVRITFMDSHCWISYSEIKIGLGTNLNKKTLKLFALMMRSIGYFFHLSRPVNVFITLLAFLISALIGSGRDWSFLFDLKFYAAALCLVMVTATGYWVNDVFDFKIDRVNKPRRVIVNAQLSVKKVLSVYFVVVLGILAFSWLFLDWALTIINAGAIALLFAYAGLLKRTTMVGNLVVAALTALVVYYAAVLYQPGAALFWAGVFAFEVNFIREVVKDIEDIEGDLRFKLQTLPIRIGIKGAKRVLFVAYSLFLLSCPTPFVEEYLRYGYLNWAYLVVVVLGVMLPALALMLDLRNCSAKEHFSRQSKYLKYLILSGMLTILLLQ